MRAASQNADDIQNLSVFLNAPGVMPTQKSAKCTIVCLAIERSTYSSILLIGERLILFPSVEKRELSTSPPACMGDRLLKHSIVSRGVLAVLETSDKRVLTLASRDAVCAGGRHRTLSRTR